MLIWTDGSDGFMEMLFGVGCTLHTRGSRSETDSDGKQDGEHTTRKVVSFPVRFERLTRLFATGPHLVVRKRIERYNYCNFENNNVFA